MSSAAANDSDEKGTPPEKSTVVLLFMIAADTTWRMFVPTLGGTFLGLWAESQWHLKPWGGIIGLGIGIIITAVLVRQQYKKAND